MGIELLVVFTYTFNVCGISSDVLFFISDISYCCLVFLCVSLARGLSVLEIFFSFIDFLYCSLVFNFVDLCSNLSFFLFAFLMLNLLLFLQFLKAEAQITDFKSLFFTNIKFNAVNFLQSSAIYHRQSLNCDVVFSLSFSQLIKSYINLN